MRHAGGMLFWFLLLGLTPAAVAADAIGMFTDVDGEVRILRGDNYLEAEPGVEIEGQDIIETEADAFAQLDMEDGSILRLGPDTRLSFSEYRLDAGKSVVSAGLDLLAGWLRFAVSKLKPGGKYSFHTSVLTAGVRGTEGTIEAAGDQGGLHLDQGEVEVSAADEEGAVPAPVRVAGGEFVQRSRGRAFNKLSQPPATFLQRRPAAVQRKLARLALDPRLRGLSPRIVRAVTKEDIQRFLQRHPRLREPLRQRFVPPVKPQADAGDGIRREPAAPNRIDRVPPGPGAYGQQEALRMQPAIRPGPLPPPGGSRWMRRMLPPVSSPPVQQAPAVDNKPRAPQTPENAPSDGLPQRHKSKGEAVKRDETPAPRRQTVPRVTREHLAPHRAMNPGLN